MKKIVFNGTELQVSFSAYSMHDGQRTAIVLNNASTGERYMVATVNLPQEPLKEDEVLIKNWSENEGIYQALVSAGIISQAIDHVATGFVYALKCKLLVEPWK